LRTAHTLVLYPASFPLSLTPPPFAQFSFGVMRKDDRQAVHELAEHYGVHSVSQDPEPHRNVVMFKSDVRPARIPKPLLSQAAAK
jgi:hypothetical protein